MAETIKTVQQFQKNMGEAIQAILNESNVDSLLITENRNHPGDFVSIIVTLGRSGGGMVDPTGFSWDLRFPQSSFDIQVYQKRLSRDHADRERVHQHFYAIGAEIQNALQPGRLQYPQTIFTTAHLPGVEVEGEMRPIYNIGPLTFGGSTLGYDEDFAMEYIRLSFDFGVQVDPDVLDALVMANIQ